MSLPIPFGWYALAYSAELSLGDVKPLFYFDEHMVLFRTEAGQAHVMEAFCPHLGAHLGHGGKVQGDALTCPFHGWQFDGDGLCVNVPYARAIPKRAKEGPCLHSYPVQERNQMIWAWYHPRRVAPLWDLDDLPELSDPDWSPVDCYDWEIESPIQESGENGVDIAHFVTVHGALAMPKAEITLDGHRRETKLAALAPAIDDEGNVDFARTETIDLVSCNCGPGMSTQTFTRKLKTAMLGAVTPITATRLKLRFAFTKPRNISAQFNMLADGMIAEIVRQVEQDIPIWEHKKYVESPLLCDGDGPIAKYRRWFSQFYDDAPAQPARATVIPSSEQQGQPALASLG